MKINATARITLDGKPLYDAPDLRANPTPPPRPAPRPTLPPFRWVTWYGVARPDDEAGR